MSKTESARLLEEFDALLDRERAAVLAGDLDCIGELLEQKQALIDALSATGVDDRPRLNTLQAKVLRNQELLDSSLRGIKAVADRIQAVRKAREGLDTYDKAGRKKTIRSRSGGSLERRA